MNTQSIKIRFVFLLHLLGVLATWVLPFWVNWKLTVSIYTAVMIQFAVFGKCLMNEHHGTKEEGDRVFYTELLEHLGFYPNPRLVKVLVRQVLYPVLAVVAIIWQVWLGKEALLF